MKLQLCLSHGKENITEVRIEICLFDNVTLVTGPKRYDFVLLSLRDIEFNHRTPHIFHSGFPIALRDTEAFVRCFHVPACIETRTARQRAQLIHKKLTRSPMRVLAAARREAGELRICAEPHQHDAVYSRGDHIISADALIQRRLSAFALRRILIWLPWLCHANTAEG